MKKSTNFHSGAAKSITNINGKYLEGLYKGRGIPEHLKDGAWSVQMNRGVLCTPNQKPENVNYDIPDFDCEVVYVSRLGEIKDRDRDRIRTENYLESIIKNHDIVLSGLFFSTVYNPHTVDYSNTSNDEHFEVVDDGYIMYIQNSGDAMAIKFLNEKEFDIVWKIYPYLSEEF